MSPRRVVAFAGWAFFGLVVLAFATEVILKNLSGHGLERYYTGKGVRFTYQGALVILVALVGVIIAGACSFLWRKWIERAP